MAPPSVLRLSPHIGPWGYTSTADPFAQAIETHRELMTVAGAERYFRQTGWLELYRRPESLAAQDRRLALSREYGIDNVKLG